MSTQFVTRDQMAEFEWDTEKKDWRRPRLDSAVLKELTERNTLNGLIRVLYYLAILAGLAVATVFVARIHYLLALPVLYCYYFVYGFWVAPLHELQHRTVFGKKAEWLTELFLFLSHTIMWTCAGHAKVAHRLHHRYTLVRGMDPEQPWPEVIDTKWLRGHFRWIMGRILIYGAVYQLIMDIWLNIKRTIGVKDMVTGEHATKKERIRIQIESALILIVHGAVIAVAIIFRKWELFAFVTIAWQIGGGFELLWHQTEHIARPYNVNDHRLNTRSVKVNWFIKSIFFGLDDHVEHHLYPAVPSRNLPRLHKILENELPVPTNMFGCWREMFAIARRKDENPQIEYVAVPLDPGTGERQTSPEDSW